MYLASANGLFEWVNIRAELADQDKEDRVVMGKYYRRIPLYGENSRILRLYGNEIIVTGPFERGRGKHWSILANELDMISTPPGEVEKS